MDAGELLALLEPASDRTRGTRQSSGRFSQATRSRRASAFRVTSERGSTCCEFASSPTFAAQNCGILQFFEWKPCRRSEAGRWKDGKLCRIVHPTTLSHFAPGILHSRRRLLWQATPVSPNFTKFFRVPSIGAGEYLHRWPYLWPERDRRNATSTRSLSK